MPGEGTQEGTPPEGQAPQPPPIPPKTSSLSEQELRAWMNKQDGYRGAMLQQQEWYEGQLGAMRETSGALGKKADLLQQERDNLKSANDQLQVQLAELQATVESVPQLQEQAQRAQTLEASNRRMHLIMQYPQIIAQTQVVETEVDGEKTTTRQNPFLELLMNSNVDDDSFERLVAQTAASVAAGQAPIQGGQPVGPGAPPPPPAGDSQGAELIRRRQEAHENGDYDLARALNDQIAALEG